MDTMLEMFEWQIEDLRRMRAQLAERQGEPNPYMSHSAFEKEVDQIDARIIELMDRRANHMQELAKDEKRRDREEADFWFRRFFTSIAIANGAAFAALAAGFLNTDDKAAIANALAEIMSFFAIGMLTAGFIPALLWARVKLNASQPGGRYLAFSAAMGTLGGAAIGTFAMGIFFCLKAVASFA